MILTQFSESGFRILMCRFLILAGSGLWLAGIGICRCSSESANPCIRFGSKTKHRLEKQPFVAITASTAAAEQANFSGLDFDAETPMACQA
jgi:hypothetical protein